MLFVFFLKLSPRFGFQHLLPNGFKPVLRKECNIYVCIQNKVAFSENYLVSPPHAKYSMSLHFLSFSDDNGITNYFATFVTFILKKRYWVFTIFIFRFYKTSQFIYLYAYSRRKVRIFTQQSLRSAVLPPA